MIHFWQLNQVIELFHAVNNDCCFKNLYADVLTFKLFVNNLVVVCNLIEREDVVAVFGINLDGGDLTSISTNGYIGDMSASIFSYVGIPFIQVRNNLSQICHWFGMFNLYILISIFR